MTGAPLQNGPAVRERARGLLHRFGRDVRGVYAVEFGLLAVPFFGLLFAILEVAWVNYNAERLQAAVDRAARQVMTGQAQNANLTSASAFVSSLLCPGTGSLSVPGNWDCSKLIVDIRTATSYVSADTTKNFYTGATQYCLGNPATIVVLRVTYPLKSFLPMSIYSAYAGLASNYPGASGWVHVLMGSAVFKTEPYSGTTPAC